MPIYKTKNKKDGIFQYSIRINYTDPQGNYKTKHSTAWGLQAAKEKEQALQADLAQGTITALTVGELTEEYLKHKKFEVKQTSFDKTQRNINAYILPQLSNIKLNKLSTKNLSDWKLSIDESSLAYRSKKNMYSELRALLNFGVKMEYLNTNPLLKVGNFKATLQEEKPLQCYTSEEYRKYSATAKELAETKGKDFFVFFSIAFYTGARKGEIHALCWQDLENDAFSITHSLNQKLKTGDIITPPKNKSSIRKIKLPVPLLNILAEHKEYQQANNPNWNESLFICGSYKSLRDTTLDKFNRKVAELAGLHRIKIHDFRHSHASVLINAGIVITEISRRLGHSDIEQTLNTYAHFFPEQEEKATLFLNTIV